MHFLAAVLLCLSHTGSEQDIAGVERYMQADSATAHQNSRKVFNFSICPNEAKPIQITRHKSKLKTCKLRPLASGKYQRKSKCVFLGLLQQISYVVCIGRMVANMDYNQIHQDLTNQPWVSLPLKIFKNFYQVNNCDSYTNIYCVSHHG